IPTNLPPLTVGAYCLNDDQTRAVLGSLQACSVGLPDKLLRRVREHADPTSLDLFAWKVFERWLAAGGPSKDKWMMGALGHLGTDATALRLAPLVRSWPGESEYALAMFGLDCLGAIGTDTALIQLHGIAQKVKYRK